MASRTTLARPTTSLLTWVSLSLVIITGLIHTIGVPSNHDEAAYKGILFVLNALAAFVAAYGIWRGERWGWVLGILVAGGAFVMYVISRTLGLPGLPPDIWAEPIGIVSLIVEAGFIIAAINALAQPRRVSAEVAPH